MLAKKSRLLVIIEFLLVSISVFFISQFDELISVFGIFLLILLIFYIASFFEKIKVIASPVIWSFAISFVLAFCFSVFYDSNVVFIEKNNQMVRSNAVFTKMFAKKEFFNKKFCFDSSDFNIKVKTINSGNISSLTKATFYFKDKDYPENALDYSNWWKSKGEDYKKKKFKKELDENCKKEDKGYYCPSARLSSGIIYVTD